MICSEAIIAGASLRTGVGAALALLALDLCLAGAKAQPVAGGPSALSDGAIKAPNVPLTKPEADSGIVAQWRAELTELATTNTAVEPAISAWLDRLLAGQVAKEVQLELLEAARKHKSPLIQEKLARYQAARMEQGGLATINELLYGGNAERGRKLFFERPKVVCIKCHKVGREGGETGPPLTASPTNRTRDFILESMRLPNAQITPGYESVAIRTKDRTGYTGMIKQESDTELTIACQPDEDSWEARLVTLKKTDIDLRRKAPSPMPDGLDMTLSPMELRDIIEFVAGLKAEGDQHNAGLPNPPGQPNGEIVKAVR